MIFVIWSYLINKQMSCAFNRASSEWSIDSNRKNLMIAAVVAAIAELKKKTNANINFVHKLKVRTQASNTSERPIKWERNEKCAWLLYDLIREWREQETSAVCRLRIIILFF